MKKQRTNPPPSQLRQADAAIMGAMARPSQSEHKEVIVQEQSVTVQVQLPPPAMLRQYEEARPGTMDLLIRWNEEEQNHRRSLEVATVEANIAAQKRQAEIMEQQVQAQREAVMYQAKTVRLSDMTGQIAGLVLCCMVIAGAIFLAQAGHEVTAGALALIPLAAIVQSFRTLTRKDARSTDPKGGNKTEP
jgi:uncharacterized membrane protein